MADSRGLHAAFRHREYLFRRVACNLYRGAFHIYDANGNGIFYANVEISESKGREEFRLYSDGIHHEQLLLIHISCPKLIDTSYNIHDPTTDKAVGTIRRKAVKSVVKDEWVFLSNEGEEIGRMTERNVSRALFGRFLNYVPWIGGIASIPAKYVIVSATGTEVAQIKQHFAPPFVFKYSMTMVQLEPSIDRRLLIAAGFLLIGL